MWDMNRRCGTGAVHVGLEPEMWDWSCRCGTGAVDVGLEP